MTELIATYESKLLNMKEILEIRESQLCETSTKLIELEAASKKNEADGQYMVRSFRLTSDSSPHSW